MVTKYTNKQAQKAFYYALGKTGSVVDALEIVDACLVVSTYDELQIVCTMYGAAIVTRVMEIIDSTINSDD